jgi:spore germination protein GerM
MKIQYVYPTRRGIIVSFVLLLMAAGGTVWAWRADRSLPVRQLSVSNQAEKKAPILQQEKDIFSTKRLSPTHPEAVPSIVTQQFVAPKNLQRKELQPKIYWLQVEGQQFRLLPKQVALNPAVSSEQALMEGMINLLSNPNKNGLDSAIPSGTRLLSMHLTSTGIYINLSREFGQGGGSSTMIYRVAQILYTATSLDPTAKVYLSIEGQLIDENHPLGGEGLMLRQPLTRQQFAEDFPLS